MPTNLMIDALRRLAVATLAYAVAVALVAGCLLPSLLSTQAVAALLPEPPTVVARSPHPAPSLRAAL
ncbi:hypothetical protein [Phenylobacterium sp.]|jgi:hypothetical protein|uniref:hypothetical protein n=1 Tax=Phenylobacterium sp. TaxID=1871053 RepID=UPI002ED8C30E